MASFLLLLYVFYQNVALEGFLVFVFRYIFLTFKRKFFFNDRQENSMPCKHIILQWIEVR